MLKLTRSLAIAALTNLLPLATSAQKPDTVALADLTIASLHYDSDTTAARFRLGTPPRTHRAHLRNDAGVFLTTWYYPGLILSFGRDGHRRTAIVQGPRYRTERGVAVGDSVDRVHRLYGRPLHGDSIGLLYASSTKEFETLGITFFIQDGRVSKIMLGEVISAE